MGSSGEVAGFTPEGLIAEIRRNAHYPVAEWRELVTLVPLDPDAVMKRLRGLLEEAETFVAQMPTGTMGLLFLRGGQAVRPDPAQLDSYPTRSAQRRGQWPSSPEITAAMLERYRERPGADPK